MRSNLDSKDGGSLMLSTTDSFGSYLLFTGLAAANIAVLALSYAIIPALATETVCYSIAS